MSTSTEKRLGALMSDLVAGTHALVTEGETGPALAQRVRENLATLGALARHLTEIEHERNGAPPPRLTPEEWAENHRAKTGHRQVDLNRLGAQCGDCDAIWHRTPVSRA